ncbi:cytochrome P450 [Sorangium sp. So ce136]|uniref:cytochrome P450 n=1 Tax=Sorangium sp. So ce136 TaxID=3133284 RepID=UPI003F05CC9D
MICPKCRRELVQVRAEPGIIVDLCAACRGIWLDNGEVPYFATDPDAFSGALRRGLREARLTGLECPRCHGGLEEGAVDSGLLVERCTRCQGLWLEPDRLGGAVVMPIASAASPGCDAAVPLSEPRAPVARAAPKARGGRVLGSLAAFLRDPLETLVEATRECGDVVRFDMVAREMLLINSPGSVKHVLQDHATNYSRSRNQSARKLRNVLGQGLLTSDGRLWRIRRRAAQAAFAPERLTPLAAEMCDEALFAAARWQHRDAGALDVYAESMRLAIGTAARTLFRYRLDAADKDALSRAIAEGQGAVWDTMILPFDLPISVPTPANLRARRATAVIEELSRKIIARRRASAEPPSDLLGTLLSTRDPETGEPLSEREMRDEIVTMLIAAPENMANTLAFALHTVARHPDVEARLRAEVHTLNGRQPLLADLDAMPYTHMVLKETLRIYPGAWAIDRFAVEEDRIQGYRVAPGTFVMLSPYAMHYNPRYWAEPARFDPERFREDVERKRPRYAYYPFGGGSHLCIGDRFAMMHLRLVFPILLRRFRFHAVSDAPVELSPQFTLRPKHGIPMRLEALA